MISLLSRLVRPRSSRRADHLRFTVYTREGCCCCDKVLDLLNEYQRQHGFAIDAVDIDADPDLERVRYHGPGRGDRWQGAIQGGRQSGLARKTALGGESQKGIRLRIGTHVMDAVGRNVVALPGSRGCTFSPGRRWPEGADEGLRGSIAIALATDGRYPLSEPGPSSGALRATFSRGEKVGRHRLDLMAIGIPQARFKLTGCDL